MEQNILIHWKKFINPWLALDNRFTMVGRFGPWQSTSVSQSVVVLVLSHSITLWRFQLKVVVLVRELTKLVEPPRGPNESVSVYGV